MAGDYFLDQAMRWADEQAEAEREEDWLAEHPGESLPEREGWEGDDE